MRISEIHIDGFGIFTDRHATGLAAGINVLYGPNEFGKSTLLHFIRRVLFGFPAGSPRANPYPALYGGVYGGRLVCELDNGDNIIIMRTHGPHGGHVTATTRSQELSGQDELQSVIGYLTATFYQNVYAIGLDELQEIKSLEGDEIRNRIYGAGLGLGSVSLTDVKQVLKKQSESLFKTKGYAYKMTDIYQEIRELEKAVIAIQKSLKNYDDLVSQRERHIEDIGVIEGQLKDLESAERLLENKERLYPVYLEYAEAESKLTDLEEVPDFTDTALDDLQARKTELRMVEEQISEKADDITGYERQRDDLVVNEQLIEHVATVITLQRLSEKYEAAAEDVVSTKQKRAALAEQIEKKIGQIGGDWNTDTVQDFNLTHEQSHSIQSYAISYDEIKGRIDDARSKLEYHTDEKATVASTTFIGPVFFKYAILAVTLVGLVGMALGLATSQWTTTALFALIFFTGALASFRAMRGRPIDVVDPIKKRLAEKLNQEQMAYDRLNVDWGKFLDSIGLNSSLSPVTAKEVVETILGIQSDLRSLRELDLRIERMHNTIDEVKRLYSQVSKYVDKQMTTDDVGANIQLVVHQLEEAKEAKLHREGLQKLIDTLVEKTSTLGDKRDSWMKSITDHVASFGTSDEDDFRSKYATHVKRKELSEKIADSRRRMQTVIGSGEHFDNFIASIPLTSPDAIKFQLDEVRDRRNILADELNNMNRTIGELGIEIEQLSSSEDMLVKQSEIEVKKQQLRDCSRDWARSQIASVVLDSAISKYESTRQPQVIKAAEGSFFYITGREYPSIVKRLDGEDLEIRDKQSRIKKISDLSRGTREQLYLAMRLGLIEEYEKRSESMPIIMDDILANFDDDRGPLAVEAINSFANQRQVIAFTCHRDTYDRYCKMGAKSIILT